MKIRDAVSAVFYCQGEVMMVKRQHFLKAFPGYNAFPGGKVDKTDNAKEAGGITAPKGELGHTLIREIQEECDFDLIKGQKEGNIKSINYLGEAITPDFNPYRFATYFFLIECEEKPDFVMDKNEAAQTLWKKAEDFVVDYEKGNMLVVPPILSLLKILQCDYLNLKKQVFDFSYDAQKYVPTIESMKGVVQAMPLSNTLPPANRTNCFIIGDHESERLVIDPSPKDEAELRKTIATLRKYPFSHFFVTHHHGDHHQFLPELVKEFKKPVMMGEWTWKQLQNKPGYEKLSPQIVKEGEQVVSWLGSPVKVYSVPGHDHGQLALAPDNKKWFLVGDLIQGIGSVVISAPEGNMSEYFLSMQKVLDFKPDVILPSHGIPMGSAFRIKKTLEHRIEREKQVLELHKQGKTTDQILRLIYSDISEKLWPLAVRNIDSHLEKLKSEGLVQ